MMSFSSALCAVKTDDIASLKEYIRDALHAARTQCSGDATAERLKAKEILSLRDDSRKQSTLLHWAAYLGNEAAVRLLAHYGADVDAVETDGKTALHWAAFEGHKGICEYLLHDRGGRYDAEDLLGNTPCHLALLKEHMAVARLFPNYRNIVVGDDGFPNGDIGSGSAVRGRRVSPRRASTSRSSSLSSVHGAARQLLLDEPNQRRVSPPSAALSTLRSVTYADGHEGSVSSADAMHTRHDGSETVAPPSAAVLTAVPLLSSRGAQLTQPLQPPQEGSTQAHVSSNSAASHTTCSAEDKEVRRARKEEKRLKLLHDLFARYVAEPPTPVRPIIWVPQGNGVRSGSGQHSDPYRDVNYSSQPRSRYERQVSQDTQHSVSRTMPGEQVYANLSHPQTQFPDVSLYGRRSSRSSTPSNSARPTWRPPSRVYIHEMGSAQHPTIMSDCAIFTASNNGASRHPSNTLSRLDVRSY